ncbi:LysR substrate-binding domain-containing protein [Pseudomonas entomophila]|uniref:LysR family transcriptional regulator n=1 Tax=Pseudomonas entomophila TaxID=312306 RepID=UPI0023D81EC8|nr:LysR substrate-binding domain-containing protein [Pseudomonas entomophila]MDF0729308.1 LysR substrate-binding domain-containing protein [Pseudomonas entomophila]
MRGFDLEQLRTLVAAVDAGSLSAATRLRNLSQSSLSEQLRKLEERAGQALLVRSKAGVRPTPAGERLLEHGRQILALSDAAWRDLHAVPLEGEVHLGITDYFRTAELTRLLARLGLDYPRLRLRTLVGRSDEIEAAHRQGALDLAIILRTQPLAARQARVIRSEALHWVAAPGARRLAPGQPIPLALLPETCALHRLALGQLEAQGIPHVVNHVASGVAGLQAAVAAGLGVACLNAAALAEGDMAILRDARLPALPSAQFLLLQGDGDPRLAELAEVVMQALAPQAARPQL